MFCERYRKTLSEAAAWSDERLPAEAQAHLGSCASCRKSFSDEKALFGLIESELRIRINAEMPASLLPRVRQEIVASTAARTWRVPAPAYIALGLAVGAIALSFAVGTKVSSVKPVPSAHNISWPAPNEPSISQKGGGPVEVLVATSKRSHRQPQVALRAEPEVLVLAEEQLGLQRYTASLRSRAADRGADVKPGALLEIKHLEIAGVDLKGLSIDPLQSGDSD
jgi:hypothetical protein